MTGRRRLAGVLGIGAVALGAVVLLHPPWVSADQGKPSVFSGTASAAAVHEEDNGQAGFAVYQPVYGSFAEGTTTYTNDGQKSRASTVWPGATFGNTGGLVCQLSCQPVPPYPLSVETSGPPTQPPTVTQQTSTNVGGAGQPASATAAEATASADPNLGVSSEAVDGAFSSPGAGPSTPAAPGPAPAGGAALGPAGGSSSSSSSSSRVLAASQWFHHQASLILQRPAATSSSAIVTVRSMTASTSQRFVGSVLQSDATTELSGVSLLGGMIDIASILTTSHATGDGAAVHDQKNDVTVSGVTVAGVPATIGSGGVTISGQGTGSGGLDALNSALQQALAAAGADVTLVGVTAKPPQPLAGCGGSQADGVFLHTATNVQEVPLAGDIYNGDYTLGSSCASVTASNPGGAAGGAGGTLPASPATGALGPASAGSTSGSTSGGSDNGSLASSFDSTTGATSASAGGTPAAAGSGARPPGAAGPTLAGQLVSRRFTTLYLSVVLALAALLVGAGVRTPRPRLRGAGPRSRP